MKEHYRCWKCKDNKWYSKKELIKRKESSGHIDFCCPKCERVIICRN